MTYAVGVFIILAVLTVILERRADNKPIDDHLVGILAACAIVDVVVIFILLVWRSI